MCSEPHVITTIAEVAEAAFVTLTALRPREACPDLSNEKPEENKIHRIEWLKRGIHLTEGGARGGSEKPAMELYSLSARQWIWWSALGRAYVLVDLPDQLTPSTELEHEFSRQFRYLANFRLGPHPAKLVLFATLYLTEAD